MSLFAELKRRNVFRVAAAYLALGWVVTQVTATLGPAFNLPASLLPIVVWIGVIGFPFVIGFSWVFELTPEGLKRESEVDRSQSIVAHTGRRLDYLVIVMVALGMLLVIADRLVPRDPTVAGAGPARDEVGVETADSNRAQGEPSVVSEAGLRARRARGTDAELGGSQGGMLATGPADKSIAVLPFVDMSQTRDQEYLSDGIAEELLNLLAKIPELRVIARTSSFAFKGEKTDIATVAAKLHVAHVLEGSVRKAGNTVRITAQLVRASDSTHLWSETYDRELDDIFAVQDEIAGAVVEQLKVALLGEAPKTRAADPRAYSLYLQAREFTRRFSVEGFERGLELSEQAIAIDPKYAAPWSNIAEIHARRGALGLRPIQDSNRLARDAVGKALALDPADARAHRTLGALAQLEEGDLVAAARHYERALALAPGDMDLITSSARFALNLGRVDLAVRLSEYATARDPVNGTSHSTLGIAYRFAGRHEEAIAATRTSLALSPGRVSLRYRIATQLVLAGGDANTALAEIEQEADESWRRIGLPTVYSALGRHAESDTALAELIRLNERDAAYNIATVYALRGNNDEAFEWLDKAIEYKDSGIADIVADPTLAPIRDDPRWAALLVRLGRTPEQMAAIQFEVTLPPT